MMEHAAPLRHPSDPMTPLSGVGSRTASVTHSELDEMWHHNLDPMSPHSDAAAEFEFVPLRHAGPSPASSIRSTLAEQRLAQLRQEHESERNRRRATVQAHADRFAALQARRRELEAEAQAAVLEGREGRRGSAFRPVVPDEDRQTVVETPARPRREEGSSAESAAPVFKPLTGSSREGSDSGLETTAVSETSAVTFTPNPGGPPPPVTKSSSIRMAGGSGEARPNGAAFIPTTTMMWSPRKPAVLSPPVRSEVSSVDDEVLRLYEAAAHSGLPPGLLLSPPPATVPEEEPASPRHRSDSENSSMSAASRRYEARVKARPVVPALKIDASDSPPTPMRTPRSPRTPRDALFGAVPSSRHSEHVARLRASFETKEGGETKRSSTHSLPAHSSVSPRFSPAWRPNPIMSNSMTTTGLSPGQDTTQGLYPNRDTTLGLSLGGDTTLGLSPGRDTTLGLSPGRDTTLGLSPGRDTTLGLSLSRDNCRIGTPVVRAQPVYRPVRDLTAVAGASRPGPNAKLDAHFRSPAPPGPLTELEQLFDSLDLDSDLAHRAERREFTAYMAERARNLDQSRRAMPPSRLRDASLDDDVFEDNPLSHSMVVSDSSRTSSDHGSYLTPIDSAREPLDSARSYRTPRSVAVPHMMPSPTSADYLLPRPDRRKLEGFPDVRLDDMAWRKLQRDANARDRVPEQPFVMRQRDFCQDTGKRHGAFRTRRGMDKRSRSTERSPSPHIIASDIPLDTDPRAHSGRYISSTILRFDHTGISTAPNTTAFASHRPPTSSRPPAPRRHSGGAPLDLSRPLAALGQAGVQTLVPRKFLLHKAASHDDIYIETETPFALNICATERDICISKVPSEEELRRDQAAGQWTGGGTMGSGGSSMMRRLSGGVPVSLRVVFGSDPGLERRCSVERNGGLARQDSFRSVYHVDLGTA